MSRRSAISRSRFIRARIRTKPRRLTEGAGGFLGIVRTRRTNNLRSSCGSRWRIADRAATTLHRGRAPRRLSSNCPTKWTGEAGHLPVTIWRGPRERLIVGTLRDLQIKFTERFAQAPPILIERFLAPVLTAQHEHTVQCIGARVSLFDRSNRRSN